MKTLLSILFYCTMAGTTATVGTVLGEGPKAAKLAPVEVVKKEEVKATVPTRPIVSSKVTKLKALGARHTSAGVVVTWATSPQGSSNFLVEHSANGKDFTKLATIPATEAVAYKYTVAGNSHQSGYYRIGTLNAEGQIEYSPSKKVKFPK